MKSHAVKVALSFVRAFVSVFVLGAATVSNALVGGDWNTARNALFALAAGAGAAGLRAVQPAGSAGWAKVLAWLGKRAA